MDMHTLITLTLQNREGSVRKQLLSQPILIAGLQPSPQQWGVFPICPGSRRARRSCAAAIFKDDQVDWLQYTGRKGRYENAALLFLSCLSGGRKVVQWACCCQPRT
eukprot:1161376-Pelagomonas_calceolata.AAC.8